MILWWGLNMVLIFVLMCLLRISGDTGASLQAICSVPVHFMKGPQGLRNPDIPNAER